MLKTIYRRITLYLPAPALLICLLGVLAGVCHIAICLSTPFADYFNETVAAFFRVLLSKITGWLPFSVAETLLYFAPVLLICLVIGCVHAAKNGWRQGVRYLLGVLSVAVLIYVLFVFTFAAGYRASPLSQKLSLSEEPVSADQLAVAAETLSVRAEQCLYEITFQQRGSSVMPYAYGELSAKLMDAYDTVCEKYPFIQSFHSRVKPLSISPLMTYTHISGVYTMFTGEANINVNYPDYVIPFTAAHELAHQRGIARENEANFVAFLVCIESEDPYIRYSGYQNMYEYVSSALYSASQEKYYMVLSSLDTRIRFEMIAYNDFFEPYRETVVSAVSDAVNNTYLTLQGTEGVKSYGMVVDLAVAYLEAEKND